VTIRGRIWVFGNHVDTDAIIPARYLHSSDPAELARHCMEGLDAGFPDAVRPGDLIVAGENFGCGSSREHAPLAIRAAGVACVIAVGFARIFYRNAINIGLPIVVCPSALASAIATGAALSATSATADGQEWAVDLAAGRVRNLALGTEMEFEPFPPFMAELLRAGGLTAYTRDRIAAGDLPRRRPKR
jgi:3-isopropylmalate/(R)-2-methylmalate dehydratase small subunit